MTQAKKAMKAKAKPGTNFIKLDTLNAENETQEEIPSEPITKRKTIISGSKEAIKTRGVIYLSPLPHGFYEKQLRKYLEQVQYSKTLFFGKSLTRILSFLYIFINSLCISFSLEVLPISK